MSDSIKNIESISSHELCHLNTTLKQRIGSEGKHAIGIFVLFGSWNSSGTNQGFEPSDSMKAIANVAAQCIENGVVGYVQVDETEDSLSACLGDNDAVHSMGPCPPEQLPALVVVAQHESMEHSVSEFVTGIPPLKIMTLADQSDDKVLDSWIPQIRDAVSAVRSQITTLPITPSDTQEEAIRIFVSGDKSSVGKSSVCLGILGSLVSMGYDPSSLAYIKPATQCEAPQLIQAYCEKVGIPCVPVGPVVYFKGFTRAFLAGETESSTGLLSSGGAAVDELARGKKLIMIDGVGFPSVGSICGTDNASMALACGYPTNTAGERSPVGVLIVGGSGVGAAVDAFNLNATYFQVRNVPVLGAVFNKLSMEGFYSLENCREQVTKYFDQTSGDSRPFGFVPLTPGIAGEAAMDHVDDYIRLFRDFVDVKGIVEAASRYVPSSKSKRSQSSLAKNSNGGVRRPGKRVKLTNGSSASANSRLSREAIEAKAKQAGAAPSA